MQIRDQAGYLDYLKHTIKVEAHHMKAERTVKKGNNVTNKVYPLFHVGSSDRLFLYQEGVAVILKLP